MPPTPRTQPPVLARPTADDALPPVAAPDAAFLLQLFLIPMIIVMIVVMVWLLFSWLAHLGTDPRELVRDLKVLNEASWQKANTLSDMLRNREYDHLKDDPQLAAELAAVLTGELASGQLDEKRIRLRIFLCRALGEFRVDAGLPALVEAARHERDPADLDVRYAAIEALAVLAHNLGSERLAGDPAVLEALDQASRETGEGPQESRRRGELRSAAAFTLGVIGGQAAQERLAEMLVDSYANARFNAATGLARHGDLRALPVLLEMLDEENPLAVADEVSDSERQRKRMLVLMNGIRAAGQLAARQPQADLRSLEAALQKLQQSAASSAITLETMESLKILRDRPTGRPAD